MNIIKNIKLFIKLGPKKGFFEILFKIAADKRYEHPMQFIRGPFEKWLMFIVRNKWKNFDPEKDRFKSIQIQTQSACNYSCPFCPNKKVKRPMGVMTIELYNKIIEELAEMDYHGWIKLYLMSEPLLDKRLEKLTEIATKKCPKAKIHIETNGAGITEERFHNIMKFPSVYIKVNDYKPGHRILKKIEKFNISESEKERSRFIKRKWDITLTNRAGNLEKTKFRLPLLYSCIRPFERMYVLFNGKCVICCSDWKAKAIVGDISKDKLLNIWKGKPLEAFRKKLFKMERNISICKQCDYLGYQREDEETLRRNILLKESLWKKN